MISTTEANRIVTAIDQIAPGGDIHLVSKRRSLFTGAIIALGVANVPPHWIMAVEAGQTERIRPVVFSGPPKRDVLGLGGEKGGGQ